MTSRQTKRTLLVGVYHLPVPLGLGSGCLGKNFNVMLGSHRGVLMMPKLNWAADGPSLGPPDLGGMLDNAITRFFEPERNPMPSFGFWGSISGWNPKKKTVSQLHVSTIVFRFAVPAGDITYSRYIHGRGHPQGAVVSQLFAAINGWFECLRTWIEVAVDQDADPTNPLSTSQSPGEGLAFLTDEDGEVSLPASSNKFVVVVHHFDLVSLARFRKVLREINAGSQPNDAQLLLRDARAALRRGQHRRAVIDAGSAAELTLASFNNAVIKVPGKKMTLGMYVKNTTIASKAELPSELEKDLVVVRNDAIHSNKIPTRTEAVQALALAKQVVDLHDPLPV